MRSSRSAPDPRGHDPLWPGPAGFAHRGLHGPEFPENSLIAFAAALEFGAGIECDLRLTRDGQIIVFHDRDARRMCGVSLVIAELTIADIVRLHVGDGPVPTIASLLSLVGGRVPLLLEVKVQDDIWRWVAALRQALTGYAGPFGIMSFDPRVSRLLKTNWPEVRRGLVIRDSLPRWRRWWAMAIAHPDFVAVEVTALGKPWVARARSDIPVYSWTVQTPDQGRTAQIHADAPIWEGDGRPRS